MYKYKRLCLLLFVFSTFATIFRYVSLFLLWFAYLPEFGSDLVAALAALNVNDLSHLAEVLYKEASSKKL